MKFTGITGEFFEILLIDESNCCPIKEPAETLRLLWFTSDGNKVEIDGIPYTFDTNQLVFLTQFHMLEYVHVESARLLRFNKPFYCVIEHDSEVGCKGILFYGASTVPVIRPDESELEVLETAWKMGLLEFEMHDNLQLEMLQMMLKRILILCTRIYKRQIDVNSVEGTPNQMIRDFNYLVESHFKEKHSVSEYAELLSKSPKTISNVFKKLGEKSPLQFIQDRIHLEARRKLRYTSLDVSEIAFDLGFNDIQAFSRFFKNQEGIPPTQFREQLAIESP